MGYLHIENLYSRPEFLECYALEKVHGTSAHVGYKGGKLHFFAGGTSHARFVGLFDQDALAAAFAAKFTAEDEVTVFGEAFGGKEQGMSATYGKELRFLAFDVKINGVWLNVPAAEGCAKELGFGFVPYARGPLTLEFLDAQRDADSLVAVEPGKPREGVVIRPICEAAYKTGDRMIFKHKRPEFRETKTVREVSPERAAVLTAAEAVAEEYVTPMRLQHVLQRVPYNSPRDTGDVVRAMQEDVKREAGDDVVWSKEVSAAVGKAAARLLHPKDVKLPSQETADAVHGS